MRIVFAIAEADPFVKTGGLGEVGGSLPGALQRQGADVRVIMPKYSVIPEDFRQRLEHINQFFVPVGWRRQYCGLEELIYNGIRYYFLDNEYYFKRPKIYGDYDEAEQYAFFSRAVLESLVHLPEFKPDILHCHDWHTALVPLLKNEFYAKEPLYYSLKTVLTIHNLKYQGIFPREVLTDVIGLRETLFTEDALEFHGAVNFMKAGLLYADWITTVSPTYAQEIQYSFYGEKLEGVLQKRRESLTGILNGIDYEVYNPYLDPCIVSPYGTSSQARENNKNDLQRILGLPVRADLPVLGMVSRLVDQKGLDLLSFVMEEILMLDVQMVILGTGDQQYEEVLQGFADKYPAKFAFRREFNDELAHKIYAGIDMLLMPSRFEPCGISQMIAMRYGVIPIVRETGGLKDTVIPYNEYTGEGNGFSFANYNAHELLFTIQRAVRLYNSDKSAWTKLQNSALNRNFSWNSSADAYIKIYKSLL
ncbi:glycogen synthase GlgA [Desulfosporosinus sp. PR]|uniref:glycogen synthase GlgA n=1 Tax=Candidatus Desulfosporosinus nitrosoreducens TaxID=3401928 RepID=UPI0027FEDCD1|nr:glycogen synthase GlgA [Desulfosporosinus sp. PR]MDQ7093720.1 glycogen synthase GlgA [Desulfosporosinus sp. PR]